MFFGLSNFGAFLGKGQGSPKAKAHSFFNKKIEPIKKSLLYEPIKKALLLLQNSNKTFFLTRPRADQWCKDFTHCTDSNTDPMSGAGTKDKKPRLAEHEVEHVVSIMEMVRVYVN
jgi:hypothetical protein